MTVTRRETYFRLIPYLAKPQKPIVNNRHGGKDGVRSHGVRSHGVRSHGVRSHEVRSHGVRSHGVRSLFMLYLLQFCPGQTSTCFGCGNPLKQGTAIPDAPNDLVVVSKMPREWMFQGRTYSKISNVYFHCATACIL